MTVGEQGLEQAPLGWFTPLDLDLLFSAISRLNVDGEIVLVGGQSLSFWVDYYDIPVPKTDTPYLTQDADFLAKKTEAIALSKILGGQLRLATLNDLTPNTATLVFTGNTGEKLLIDFLGVIVGLDQEEIRRLAIPVERDGWHLFILHPIHCLRSRISNLSVLPSKRNRNGIEQAKVAIEVAKRYLNDRLQEHDFHPALKIANRIAKLAQRWLRLIGQYFPFLKWMPCS